MQCVQWLLEDTSAADEMSDDNSRFALIHLTIQNGQDDCLKCLLAYIRDKYLELGKLTACRFNLAQSFLLYDVSFLGLVFLSFKTISKVHTIHAKTKDCQ